MGRGYSLNTDTETSIETFSLEVRKDLPIMNFGGGLFILATGKINLTDSDIEDGDIIRVGNIEVHSNSAYSGGGIAIINSSVKIDNSKIEENKSNQDGGGIIILTANVTIKNSYISTNQTLDGGGGICCEQNSNLRIDSSTINKNASHNNIRNDSGGGIAVSDIYKLEIVDSKITGNNSFWSAGLSISKSTNVVIKRSTISQNTADDAVGGMSINYGEYIIIDDVEISQNVSRGQQGLSKSATAIHIHYHPNSPYYNIRNLRIYDNISNVNRYGVMNSVIDGDIDEIKEAVNKGNCILRGNIPRDFD